MKYYLEAKADMFEELTMLDKLEDKIEAKRIGSLKQKSIAEFFAVWLVVDYVHVC